MSYAGSRLDGTILSWNLNGTKDVSVSVNGVRLNETRWRCGLAMSLES